MDYVVVLAAGRGVRAGGPKALHVVNGRVWWKIQRERLARVGLPAVWVVSERVRDGMGGDVPERLVAADEMAPMFASVVAGMHEVERWSVNSPTADVRGVFVLPVDVPAPGPEVFERLRAHLPPPSSLRSDPSPAGAEEGACAANPVHAGKHGHPVYVAWRFVRERVLRAAGDARLDRLIEDGGGRVEVEVGDARVCVNLNTAAEFEAWSKMQP